MLFSPHIQVPHGFSTRGGGVSQGAFAGLNLDDRQDDSALVAENRRLLTAKLGFLPEQVARLEQVHGTEVLQAKAGVQTGDALVTAQRGLLLAIGTADCYPILLADEEAGVIGAAHAGWRGTVGRIAARTVRAMQQLGAQPQRIKAAIGPGICGERYAVGAEVAQAFESAGLGACLRHGSQIFLDLAQANRQVLEEAGVRPEDIWVSGRCTTEADFYSYRRDAGVTGRMWAVIGLPSEGA